LKASVESLGPTRVRIDVEVPFEELAPSIDTAYKRIARQVKIQGFRPGKVPPRILDQRVGRGAVLEEAVNQAIPRLYGEAVESTSITPFALGKFLANGTLDMSNPFVSHYFGNDETQEYIIFDVLKSDSISVTAKTETGTTVEADIGALSGALKANVSAKASSTSASEITFEGKAKATFAFKLFEVLFENGKWVPKGAKADDDLSFAVGEDEAGVATVQPAMISPGRLIRLR